MKYQDGSYDVMDRQPADSNSAVKTRGTCSARKCDYDVVTVRRFGPDIPCPRSGCHGHITFVRLEEMPRATN